LNDKPSRDGARSPLLEAMSNMTAFHREHEKFYSVAPREQAALLQRHSRTLHALADRWTSTKPAERQPFSPYEGAPDLNAAAAVQLDGVQRLYSAAEMIDHAADLLSDFAGLVHDNERRWRVVHGRVEEILQASGVVNG
jgi:hypothetical protein